MKRLSSTIVCTLLLFCRIAGATPTVTVITIGPGDASYERFGHNMLRINDPDLHFDACYNWGLFDFDAPNFIGNFILGRMTYSMDAFEPHSVMAEYLHQDRQVRMQVLKLSPSEADAMLRLCETNRLPQNTSYRYDYFRDNCSTRVRDMIDTSTGGRLSRDCLPVAKPSGLSYRQHTLRLMQDDFWLSFGIDFCLGPTCDRPLTAKEECFLPGRLSVVIEPMSQEQGPPWQSKRPPEPPAVLASVPNRVPLAATVGLAIAILTGFAARWRRWAGVLLVAGWLLVSGLAGGLLAFLWCTDHAAAHANQNMLFFSPIALVVLLLLVFKRLRKYACPLIVAIVIVSGAAMGLKLFGVLTQQNGTFIALAIPLNLAALCVLMRPRLTPAHAAIEVTAP